MSCEKTLDQLKQSISSLEKRIEKIEGALLTPANNPVYIIPNNEHPTSESILDKKINLESFSGATQLGWLGIAMALLFCCFFVRYCFVQNWVTGLGQVIVLALLGLIFFSVSSYIRIKNYPKFGGFLGLIGALLFFMAIYWSSIRLSLTGPYFLLISSLSLWLAFLLWAFLKKTSLWALWGLGGSCLLPLFVLPDFMGTHWLILYYTVIVMGSFALTLLCDWPCLSAAASLMTHLFVFVFIRNINLQPQLESTHLVLWKTTLFPAIFILWSGFLPLTHKRPTFLSEKFTWGFNNIALYFYLFAFWGKFNTPWLVLIPVALNAILYFTTWLKKQSHDFLFLVGTVLSTAIALTILMPIPLDIITLCLFAVLLGHKGNREDGWQLKTVSGTMIIWSLIFLFSMRFHFTAQEDIPFFNLKFVSFVITFLCFGYQGRMINNDLKAKNLGPLLGQGLFSLGLAVLLLGMGSEIMRLFPSQNQNQISQLALLFLTVLGGFFAFCVAYVGVVLKLFFIRILSIFLYLLLVFKLLFFDFFRLELLYLVISLGCIGLLLGGTSILLKSKFPILRHLE